MSTSPFRSLLIRFAAASSQEGRRTNRDRLLAQRLYQTLERDLELADVQGIHVYVQNGVVTLYGPVRTVLDRDLLVSLLRQVPGVKGVVSHLQVVDPSNGGGVTFYDRDAPGDAPVP